MAMDRITDEDVINERRASDRELHKRLDEMEHSYRGLNEKVMGIESSLKLGALEILHLKDLFEARLKIIEKSGEVQLAETKALGVSINAMAGDPDKSPAGRTVLNLVATQAQVIDEHTRILAEHAGVHVQLKTWQNQIDGSIGFLKYVGFASLVTLIIFVWGLFRK